MQRPRTLKHCVGRLRHNKSFKDCAIECAESRSFYFSELESVEDFRITCRMDQEPKAFISTGIGTAAARQIVRSDAQTPEADEFLN